MPHSNTQSRLIDLLKLLGVAVLYALLSHLVHLYFERGTDNSAFEPAAGLALAALLIGGKRYMWSVLFGALTINALTIQSFWAVAAVTLGNTLEALCGAWLLTLDSRFNLTIQSLRDYLRLIIVGGGVGVASGVLAGATALLFSGFLSAENYAYYLSQWWAGDVLGIILIAPLILVGRQTRNEWFDMKWLSEATLLIGLTFLAGQIVFLDWFHDSIGVVAKAYWMFAFIAWVAVRLRVRGVVVVLVVTAIQALLGAYFGTGFFARDIADTHLSNYWSFMVILSVVGMALATYLTERTQAEEALRHSETRLRTLYDSTSDAVLLLDEKGFFDCNRAALAMFGCATREALCSKHPADLSPPLQPCGTDSLMLSSQEIATAMAMGSNHFEWLSRRADNGQIFPADILLNAMELEGRRVLQATVRDITERKQNELALDRLSRVYRLLGEVNEAIVRVRDRDELFAAICNAAAASGLFRLAWIGMVDERKSLVVPVAHAGVEQGYLDKLDIRLNDERSGKGPTGRAMRDAVHVIVADIEHDPCMLPWRDEAIKRGYLASAAFPIREAGSVVGAINVYASETHFFTPDIVKLMIELADDISFSLDVFAAKKRREQAEEEIKLLNIELETRIQERTRQLELSNKELEAFSYSVSHDLRAPLRSIDGFSQVLAKKYHDQLDETGKDYLDRVRRASQRMGHLIDDMLELSQVSRSQLKRVQVDLSAMANIVAEELRKTDPERHVRFTVQQGLSAHADPGLLRIVMDNLLGNAYKYTGKTAEAEIGFGACSINGEHVFFVRDNGVGFNMDYVHKLFGAFQRLHGVNEFEGTGIGLATVQRIVHRHHGRVWAEGKEGEGAVFYFMLPRRAQER